MAHEYISNTAPEHVLRSEGTMVIAWMTAHEFADSRHDGNKKTYEGRPRSEGENMHVVKKFFPRSALRGS